MSAATVVRRVAALATATALAVLAAAGPSAACPVCFAADERTRASFLGTAVFLSALPFVLFAGVALWFWRELGRPAAAPSDLAVSPRDRRSR